MSIKEEKKIHYTCDACSSALSESEIFRGYSYTLWSDRDVSARISANLNLIISYHSGNTDICRKCALATFKTIANLLEKSISIEEAKP